MDVLDLVHDDPAAVPGRPIICLYNPIHPDHDGAVRDGTIDGSIVCQKRFTRRSDCIRHERIHTNERPYLCEHEGCGKRFVQKSALTVHARIHSGEKPHSCDTCGKPFTDSSSLARHRRLHSGNKPYECQVEGCGKSFIRKITLGRHHKSQHPLHPFPLRRGKRRSASATASASTTTSRSKRRSKGKNGRVSSYDYEDDDEEDEEDEEDDYDDDEEEDTSPVTSGSTLVSSPGRSGSADGVGYLSEARPSTGSSMAASSSPYFEPNASYANQDLTICRAHQPVIAKQEPHNGIEAWQSPTPTSWMPAPASVSRYSPPMPWAAAATWTRQGPSHLVDHAARPPPASIAPLRLAHSNLNIHQHQISGIGQNISSLRATAALPSSTSVSPASATFGGHGEIPRASWMDDHRDRILPPLNSIPRDADTRPYWR